MFVLITHRPYQMKQLYIMTHTLHHPYMRYLQMVPPLTAIYDDQATSLFRNFALSHFLVVVVYVLVHPVITQL